MSFAQHLLDRVMSAPWPHCDLHDRRTLTDNLEFMLQLMVASEPLVDLAARQAGKAGDIQLRDYYLSHAEEERGHAAWLTADLASAGITSHTLSIDAVEAAGAQYYLLLHAHPAAFLGYMAVLECMPVPVEHVTALEASHGPELLRTLRFHAEHDIHHGADIKAQIDKLPPELQELILNNAMNTMRHLINAARRFGKG